jgi:hypothetical protein
MVSADENTPTRGKGKAKGAAPGKKPEKRSRKPRQKAEAKAEQLPETQELEAQKLEVQELEAQELEAQEQIDAPVASAESSPAETAMVDVAPVAPAESSPGETAVVEAVAIDVEPAAPAESPLAEIAAIDVAPIAPAASAPVEEVVSAESVPAPVSLQTITNAYGDYTRKSIEQTSSFFEQLAGARSFDKAFQLQTEYARQAYETFVAESRKIRELHCELTMQRVKRLEGLVTGTKATGFK